MRRIKPHRKIFQFDPILGYRFIPNLHLRIMLDRPIAITTNEEGFRGEFSYRLKNDTGLRILALGDSYLAGDGVSNKQRFTNLIQEKTGWCFLNCGLPGSGTDQQLLIQEKIAKDWDYDVLLLVPFNYNIYRNLRDKMYVRLHRTTEIVEFKKPYFTLEENGDLKLHGFPVSKNRVQPAFPKNGDGKLIKHLTEKYPEIASSPLLRRYGRAIIDVKNVVKYRYLNQPSDAPFTDREGYPWRLMRTLTERMIENAGDKKVILAPIPQHDHIKYKAYPNYLDRFLELGSERVKVIDLSPVFQTYSVRASRELFNKYDSHFTPKAQELIAEYLTPELQSFLNAQTHPHRDRIAIKTNDVYVLGISCFYHDSAAAIIKNGKIVAAAHEERFTRRKHDSSFPLHAANYCLEEAKIDANQLSAVVYYDDPVLSLERVLVNHLVTAKERHHWYKKVHGWIQKKFSIYDEIKRSVGYDGELFASLHHRSHAASAFYPSPFEEAAIVVVDAVGEWATTSLADGKGNAIRILKELHYPHSLGLLYSAFTAFCGFKVNSGEYKLMGLAPYGEPKYCDLIKEKMLDVNDDGSFTLNLEYFAFMHGDGMYSEKFRELFGVSPRKPEMAIGQIYMDIASSIQRVTEEILLRIVRHAHELTGREYLVMAGGVALNCVANGKLLEKSPFRDIWIQPASGDAGGALGAALDYYYNTLKRPRSLSPNGVQANSLYGPSYSADEIRAYLEWYSLPFKKLSSLKKHKYIVKQLVEGKVVGFFTDRMEYGPRALGARSILADPRNPQMQSTLNLKIKYRESFRPFAPVVLEEDAATYFELDRPSPFMLLVKDVVREKRQPIPKNIRDEQDLFKKVNFCRSEIPAVTHVDYSARIQTVNKKQNEQLYGLMHEFKKATGCSVLVNTSFNVRGEPIVCTPDDAYRCFMRTEMDVLVLGDYILLKEDQPPFKEEVDWRELYELD